MTVCIILRTASCSPYQMGHKCVCFVLTCLATQREHHTNNPTPLTFPLETFYTPRRPRAARTRHPSFERKTDKEYRRTHTKKEFLPTIPRGRLNLAHILKGKTHLSGQQQHLSACRALYPTTSAIASASTEPQVKRHEDTITKHL